MQLKYRNLPIKGAPPHNKGAPLSLEEDNGARNHQNDHSFFYICPILNPKPAFESLNRKLRKAALSLDY